MNGGRVLSVGGNGHGSVGSVRVAENEPLDTHDTHSTPAPRDTHEACHTGRTTRNAPRTKMHTVHYAYDVTWRHTPRTHGAQCATHDASVLRHTRGTTH